MNKCCVCDGTHQHLYARPDGTYIHAECNIKSPEEIHQLAEEVRAEVKRLKDLGWTQKDFAKALKKMFDEQA